MQVHPREGWSPGKTHIIKLYEKNITVHLSYSSPPKAHKYPEEPDSPPSSHTQKEEKRIRYRSKKKKEIGVTRQKEKEFYVGKIDECQHILAAYEEFQLNILEKKTKKRMKVYSNSKTQSQEPSPYKYQPVPIKNISLNQQDKPKPSPTGKILLTKRTQKGSGKVESRHLRNPTAIIRLYDNQNTLRSKADVSHKLTTPSKVRTQKIQVTSSRRQKKNDSLLSRGPEMSNQLMNNSQILTRRYQRSEERGESVIVNSFNVSVLH